jgi:hypothetical protein
MAHLRADAPPILVIHGDHDSVTPVEGARRFAERYAVPPATRWSMRSCRENRARTVDLGY